MNILVILLILILLLGGGYGYRADWHPGSISAIGLIVVILIVLLLTGRL